MLCGRQGFVHSAMWGMWVLYSNAFLMEEARGWCRWCGAFGFWQGDTREDWHRNSSSRGGGDTMFETGAGARTHLGTRFRWNAKQQGTVIQTQEGAGWRWGTIGRRNPAGYGARTNWGTGFREGAGWRWGTDEKMKPTGSGARTHGGNRIPVED